MNSIQAKEPWNGVSFSRKTLLIGGLFFLFVWLEFAIGIFNISDILGSLIGKKIPSDFGSLISYAIMLLSGILIFRKELFAELNKKTYFWKNLGWSSLLLVLGYACSVGISVLLSSNNIQDANQENVASASVLFQLLGASIIAPVAEELYFRFYLYNAFRKKSILLAVSISAILFAFWHTIASIIFGNFTQLISTISYLPMGIAFALMYEKTQNIKYPIIMHLANNTITTVIILLSQSV